jgi:hypothetical protein
MALRPHARRSGFAAPLSFLLRQIIAAGYVHAGYKDASPWRNVARINHSNDTFTNLGDVLQYIHAYAGGFSNADKAWITRGVPNWLPATTNVSTFNMRTETTFGGNYSAPEAIADCDGMWQEQLRGWMYAHGASSNRMRFNLVTEAWISSLGGNLTSGGSGHATAAHETRGWAWADGNTSSNARSTTFATETEAVTNVYGNYGQQKGISSKLSYVYAGNEGDYAGGNNLRRFNVATETNVGNVAKPIGNSGEENFDMGQEKQFMAGMYNGLQNTRSWRFNYTTDSGYEITGPAGTPGRSSGYCSWRS